MEHRSEQLHFEMIKLQEIIFLFFLWTSRWHNWALIYSL